MREQDAHNPISTARIEEMLDAKDCAEGNAHSASRDIHRTTEGASASRIFALRRDRWNDQDRLRLE
jgi:hypothetical protein